MFRNPGEKIIRRSDSTLDYATPRPAEGAGGLDYLAKTAILASVIQFLWFLPGVLMAQAVRKGLQGGFGGNTLALGVIVLPASVSVVCGVIWLVRSARRSGRGLILAVLLATVLAGGWLGGAGRFWVDWMSRRGS